MNCKPSPVHLAGLKINGKRIVCSKYNRRKKKILQCCWRDQLVSALKAVMSSASLSETMIWSPCFVPRSSTESVHELLNWDRSAGACKTPQEWGAACISHKGETLEGKKTVAWRLGIYCCKHVCLSFPVCKITRRASSCNVFGDSFTKKLQ